MLSINKIKVFFSASHLKTKHFKIKCDIKISGNKDLFIKYWKNKLINHSVSDGFSDGSSGIFRWKENIKS